MGELESVGHSASQPEDVRRFFSSFAAQWDSLYGRRRNLFWRAFDHAFRRDVYERYRLTFDALGRDLTGMSVLDVGCGSGIYCFEAARRGASRVVGVDISPDMVSLASAWRGAEIGGEACEFIVSEFPPTGSDPRLSSPFDFAIVMGVMDYIADAGPFLAALRPLVRRRAVLSFPGRHWLRGPVRRYRYRALRRCDVYDYDESAIHRDCARAGFSRTEINRLNHSGICHIVTLHV